MRTNIDRLPLKFIAKKNRKQNSRCTVFKCVAGIDADADADEKWLVPSLNSISVNSMLSVKPELSTIGIIT